MGARWLISGLLEHLASFRAGLAAGSGGERSGVEISRRSERQGVGILAAGAGGAEGAECAHRGAELGSGAAADWLKLLFRLTRPLLRNDGDVVVEPAILFVRLFTRRSSGLAGLLARLLLAGIARL